MAGFFSKNKDRTTRAVKKTVGVKEITQGWGLVRRLASPLDPRRLKGQQERIESFQTAYRRMNLTEEDLQKNYFTHFLRFWMCALFLLLGVALSIVFFTSGHWQVIFPAFGFMAICIGQMFSASFLAFQIRNRALCPARVWWGHKEQWLPMTWTLPPAPIKKTMSEGLASALERERRREKREKPKQDAQNQRSKNEQPAGPGQEDRA